MTAMIDQKSQLMRQLISSCYKSQDDFRTAAEAVDDETVKKLFGIYSQQRTRFAEELREHLPLEETECVRAEMNPFGEGSRQAEDSLHECLETEVRTLALYKQALADRALSTRAHFLISAQLALMQRVHDRVQDRISMLLARSKAGTRQAASTHRMTA